MLTDVNRNKLISYFEQKVNYHRKEEGLWLMSYRYNVSCCDTSSRNWTPTAIDCYSIGCQCSKCFLFKIYFKNSDAKCMMKQNVIELVRKYGVPKEVSL